MLCVETSAGKVVRKDVTMAEAMLWNRSGFRINCLDAEVRSAWNLYQAKHADNSEPLDGHFVSYTSAKGTTRIYEAMFRHWGTGREDYKLLLLRSEFNDTMFSVLEDRCDTI